MHLESRYWPHPSVVVLAGLFTGLLGLQVKSTGTASPHALPPGATATVAVGNRAMMNKLDVDISAEFEAFMSQLEDDAQTAVVCAVDGAAVAVFGIAGNSKPPTCVADIICPVLPLQPL